MTLSVTLRTYSKHRLAHNHLPTGGDLEIPSVKKEFKGQDADGRDRGHLRAVRHLGLQQRV
jgi:hypothetical protein